MNEMIYLDNSATTPLSDAAKQAMLAAMEQFGNPSSLHPIGKQAQDLVQTARRQVAHTLGIRTSPEAGQITFTASGTEADNLAIFGTAYAKERRRGGKIITTDSEHPAAENAFAALEKDGFEVVRISTRGGELDWDQYKDALNKRVFLVSLMTVNNETGALYDLKKAFSMAKALDPAIVTHTDAVQGYLKSRFLPTAIKADLVTLSAHKIHGPKGVGALYASTEALKRRDFVPTVLGGGQENGFRSGTENVIGIAGFGAAAEEEYRNLAQTLPHLQTLRDSAKEKLSALPVIQNIPTGSAAPHILSITLPDIRSETMLHALSRDGICVSAGSACSSHAKKVSRALTAFGLSPAAIECTLRISFGRQNTLADVDRLAESLQENIDRLVKIHR
ncbi:MAG: cysteine desulfurase [Clostridia bacterium]|nr:cysteine desulfurase [Clostridia bacterium]